MKRMICLSAMLIAGSLGRADDAAARKVIDRAMKAVGQEPDVHRKAVTWKGKGLFYGMAMEFPYEGTWAVQYPDKMRMEIPNVVIVVVNGEKGWMKAGGETREFTNDEITEHQESLHADMISELSPLLDRAYTLAPVREAKAEDKPAVSITVSHKGRRDVTLFFDRETGLLTKMDQIVKDDAGKEVLQETYFKSYETKGKARVPMKMLVKRDGKTYVDGEMYDHRVLDKLPAGTFDKP